MKVIEKGTDRKAEVHIHVDGDIKALAEYGQYIDPRDKAVCCYVPVKEGDKTKIGGRFDGTTFAIAYDAVVDGVLRKASSSTAKTVRLRENEKLDVKTFLCRTGKETIDAAMLVAPVSGVTATQGEGKETIGSMELRLYITRQLGVTHTPGRLAKYDSISGNIEDDIEPRSATWKLIAPDFQMAFEKDTELLDKSKVNREHRKMDAKRPGTEPWAIFRFHYRSQDTITEHKLNLAYHPVTMKKTEPHTLDLEPVPPLQPGSKPPKDDGDSSTQASSVTPDVPTTPVKVTQSAAIAKPSALLKQQPPKTTNTPVPTPKMTSTTKETTKTPEITPDLEVSKLASAPPSTQSSFKAINKAATAGDKDGKALISASKGDNAKSAIASKDNIADGSVKSGAGNGVSKPSGKPIEEEKLNASDKTTIGVVTGSAAPSKTATKKDPQVVVPSTKKSATTSTTNVPSTSTTQKRPASTPGTPENKLTIDPSSESTTQNKRPRPASSSATSNASVIVPRSTSSSASPRPMSIERKVAEQRKKLEAIRQKRLETAKKQEELDRKMEPYKKRMAEELERLDREMLEEAAAAAEDEEHFKASEQMLKEFEMAK